MCHLLLVGSNHRQTEIGRLEVLSQRVDRVVAQLAEMRHAGRIRGAVVLATCNRFEVVVELPEGERLDPAAQLLFPDGERDLDGVPLVEFEDEHVVHHLLRVATGQESLVAGEDQILGQLRRAFQHAEELGLLSRGLHILRTRLLHTARELRKSVGLDRRMPSVASVAAHELLHAGPRLAVVGAGEMARLALETLRRRHAAEGVLVVNRTLAHAQALAANFGGEAMSLDHFRRTPPALDGVLFAVASDEVLLRAGQIPGLSLAIDVGHPSVLDPELGRQQDGLSVIDLDSIGDRARAHSEKLESSLANARNLAESAATRLWGDLSPRRDKLSGVVDLHVEGALSELERALGSGLRHLSDADRDQVRATLIRAAKRTAHYHMRDLQQVLAR